MIGGDGERSVMMIIFIITESKQIFLGIIYIQLLQYCNTKTKKKNVY